MSNRKSTRFVPRAKRAILLTVAFIQVSANPREEIELQWINKSRRELAFIFNLREEIDSCLKMSKSMEISLTYQLCSVDTIQNSRRSRKKELETNRQLAANCSKTLELVRKLRISFDGDSVSLSQDVIGDKLPGITYFYSDLVEAITDLTGSFIVVVPDSKNQIRAKLVFKCSKVGSQRLSKFLSFLTGKYYFKKYAPERIFHLD